MDRKRPSTDSTHLADPGAAAKPAEGRQPGRPAGDTDRRALAPDAALA